ncbi:MAG: methyltransferase [Bacteroidales bacterium]|jgi:tRNA1Val (adenine37-N6)-methyltransferase|nr:methyltransferase [Bacteroidales bacterium]
MANSHFRFKQFTVHQEHASFRITTDSVLLGAWAELQGVKRILDIGTGTGILALMAAQRSDAYIVAIEPDRNSFMQAGLNIAGSPWHDRISLINTSAQEYLSGKGMLFDTIITNPPFFNDSLLNPDPGKASTRHSITLSHRELLESSLRLMSPGGTLQTVLPVNEAATFMDMASAAGLSCSRRLIVKPTPLLPPARILMTLGFVERACEEATVVIEKGGRHEYSDEYKSLTKDFYLRF